MSQGELVVQSEQEIVEIVERVLRGRRVEQAEMQISPKDLQIAILEIRDAIRLQAKAVTELTNAVQLAVSRGSGGGAGGY